MHTNPISMEAKLPPTRAGRATLFFVLLALAATIPTSIADDGNSGDSVPSLSEMDTYDALAIALIVVALAISAAGGVGGGVIMVPAMVLIMGFDIKRATPISNMAMLGGAVANAWFNMRKRHPFTDRPLIDPDLSLCMIPVVIGGTVLGAVINKLLPSYLVSLLFVVVLAVSCWRMTVRGIRLHKKERREANIRAAVEAVADVQVSPSVYVEASTPQFADNDNASEGNVGDAFVACGEVAYWAILLIEIPWVAVFVVVASHYLYRDYQRKAAVNYPYMDGDVRWTRKTVVLFPMGCAFGGIVAGMFGVGGGLITGPVMIELGVVPEVASSTMAWMILYSSAAATAKYSLFNMIAWEWAALLCAVTFVVTSAAQVVILSFVRRTGRQSIIILCICVSMIIGTMLMTYQAVTTTIEDREPFSTDICK
ncbi:hypothetical protein BBJ29_000388 [Phytophthora kernoviae]|uniref:Membrane transporter protein n=1 Tax=Phytophthora kernoviae TaxID=325452 RepID=A0A3F2RZJ8_9STRA|nr:hypothetical protein BBJ29_000388 [Phytophthora kernoviae]RLN67322.1 hypothetical protein BBP00_00001712 [Phytophthora kernoviae]